MLYILVFCVLYLVLGYTYLCLFIFVLLVSSIPHIQYHRCFLPPSPPNPLPLEVLIYFPAINQVSPKVPIWSLFLFYFDSDGSKNITFTVQLQNNYPQYHCTDIFLVFSLLVSSLTVKNPMSELIHVLLFMYFLRRTYMRLT